MMSVDMQRIQTYLSEHAGEAQELLERLCRQPSISAQNIGIAEMANLVETLLQESGFSTQKLVAQGSAPAVFGEIRGRSSFTLLLYNHYDVQPPEPLELWESPPFEPTVRDGKLYARGVADNKAEIATRLTAIRALLALYGELPITIRWLIEGEEEIGSVNFDAIAEKYTHLLQADGALWEGANFGDNGRPELMLGAKGLLYVQLDADGLGVDAHSGSAPILPSAAWKLVQALATLRSPSGKVLIPGFYDAVKEPTEQQIAALAAQDDTEEQYKQAYHFEEFVDGLSGLELRKRQAFAPTCNIAGLLSGYTGEGTKTVLPARAMAKLDFRLVPDQDPEDILAKLKAHLVTQGYGDIRITAFDYCRADMTPIEDPFVQRIQAIAEAFAGKPAEITPLGGGTLPLLESLRKRVGLPGLSAPGNAAYWGSAAHSPNENIRLADLERAVQFNCYLFASLGEA
ncbi:acetylornithine deacetylase/succinyl-diaminopimelate desuccinylase-like protein [Thermosporothrix hazakensis]|jgi:acetylornithine deacetylase/succinyl-diaminopimelate desuccinylase-like protein|uniref:Acetylornithine deacetylase/succinyl-diaminopimelate desuccinylase-like protein n=1 Tax=Thermosporothrix hazakensis TaxID=644383 RepID=A0A326U251_THEHA|nr:M20/M25/M40 family metallo-hydrolase [Thermosporothrix hazakensis]PZW24694.1 acetylornithine deacetylase/succinyl-diaminopimelate desuccinylase-like protein [Thermosporothrix hazakensis]